MNTNLLWIPWITYTLGVFQMSLLDKIKTPILSTLTWAICIELFCLIQLWTLMEVNK